MRWVAASALFLILPLAAQAQFLPRTPPPVERMPGIADRGARTPAPSIGRELRKTFDRIADGWKNGELSKREAHALRREARQIDRLWERYGRDGLSDSERRELEMRAQALQGLTGAQRLRGRSSEN